MNRTQDRKTFMKEFFKSQGVQSQHQVFGYINRSQESQMDYLIHIYLLDELDNKIMIFLTDKTETQRLKDQIKHNKNIKLIFSQAMTMFQE